MVKASIYLLSLPSFETMFWMGVAGIACYWLANYLNRQDGLTKSDMFWANYQEPIVYRQRDINDRDATIAAYDNAVAMLKEKGNQHIDATKHIYLWLYGAEEEKMNIDFAEWAFQAKSLEKRIAEDYRKEKLKQAAAANGGNSAEGAKYFAGVKPDFDDTGDTNN